MLLKPRDSKGHFLKGIKYSKDVPRIQLTCFRCTKLFLRFPCYLKKATSERYFCSRECYWEAKKGEKQKQLLCKNGKFKRKIAKKIAIALQGKPQPWNNNAAHHEWKGKEAGYTAMHQWLRRKFGRADRCENPDHTYKNPKRYEWSLIHGYEYDHIRENYWMLCASCHRKYDLNS